jgi:hypothetical protein
MTPFRAPTLSTRWALLLGSLAFIAVSSPGTAEAQLTLPATAGWTNLGEAWAVTFADGVTSYINEAGNEVAPPGAPPTTGSRTNGLSCRGWGHDVAEKYLKVPKEAVGSGEQSWGTTMYSSALQRAVRVRWHRWTTWEGWGGLIPKGHCRIEVERTRHEIRLYNGQQMKQGDLMFWIRSNASTSPDAVGAAIQGATTASSYIPASVAGKAGHVAMCGGLSGVGDCKTLFQADSYATMEGMIGHRNNWKTNVAEFVYDALRNGLDKTGVAANSATIALNTTRNIYVFRSCNPTRINRALQRFNDRFVNPSSGSYLPAADRLYYVKAFTQNMSYGQCSSTQETMWDFTAHEGGNVLNLPVDLYKTMVASAWDKARDYLDSQVNGVKDMFFNERRTASVILHAFTDTGKSWSDLNPLFGSDSASRDFARDSAGAKNPSGLTNMNSPVAQWASITDYSSQGCHVPRIDEYAAPAEKIALPAAGTCDGTTPWVADGKGGLVECKVAAVTLRVATVAPTGYDLEPDGTTTADVIAGTVCVPDTDAKICSDGCGKTLCTSTTSSTTTATTTTTATK